MPTENRVSVVLPPEIVKAIDAVRGGDSRSLWLREAVQQRLDRSLDDAPVDAAVLPVKRGATAAPTRPKRRVNPIPKSGR